MVNMLEIGSGVGNAIFPLLEENPNMFIYACDFSPRAIQFIKVTIIILLIIHFAHDLKALHSIAILNLSTCY